MLCRSYITEEISTCCTCNGTTDSRCNVIISHCYVGHEGTKDIERCAFADLFLDLYVQFDLVYGHMTRSFNNYLNTFNQSLISQFSKGEQFFDLASVRCTLKAAGTESVPKTQGQIIFFCNLKEAVI